jgi:hypothetical protein
MTCPICISVDNTSLVEGLRAGAVVLIVVGGVLIAAASRFAWRLRKLDLTAEASAEAIRRHER